MSEGDRRAPGATRIPFEAMVEVGGAFGPGFEAQAVDVSRTGMHLRTAYLPEIGQPLTCRFETGPNQIVLASGQVVWAEEASRGGEFGICFVDLDAESARCLAGITGAVSSTIEPAPRAPGGKVRLHIDGLGSPMRARVKGGSRSELTVGSELGFLQVGKELELENAETGAKRPARIDRVEVQIDPESHVPQLVVALRYADEAAMLEEAAAAAQEDTPGPITTSADREERDTLETRTVSPEVDADPSIDPEAEALASEGDAMKGALARTASKVGPAIDAFAKRAKTAVAVLAAKKWRARGEAKDDVAIPVRRVTAPPPGGGLHAEGRKVVRDTAAAKAVIAEKMQKLGVDKKKMIAGGVIGVGVILGAMAMRGPSASPPKSASLESEAPIAAAVAAPSEGLDSPAAGRGAANAVDPSAAGAAAAGDENVGTPYDSYSTGTSTFGRGAVSDAPPVVAYDTSDYRPAKRAVVRPFANGPVTHGNILRLKMDGAIEKLQGAQQPTGFTVVVPSRKSLEAASPLAARDSRIASIRVLNDPGGAELSVVFKDGVPNYQVRAKGDVLEIVLAPTPTAARGAVAQQQAPARAKGAPAAPAARRSPAADRTRRPSGRGSTHR